MSPMFDENFLSMVRCPATHQRLQMAEESLMRQLRAAIDEKRIVNRLGERIAGGGFYNQF
jgi:uncharacterized protein YbaR (Trm112 family)